MSANDPASSESSTPTPTATERTAAERIQSTSPPASPQEAAEAAAFERASESSDAAKRQAGGPDERPVVALAGATGFVGTALRHALAQRYRLVGLTRSPARARAADDGTGTEWRHCDLFSLSAVRRGLEGADYAIYLVHSMAPSSRLMQGDFADFDLILADNFARAAEAAGVRQIVYIGGLIPDDRPLSPHLASRLEVEETLGACGVPVTALRAGLIVGPGGSSTRILVRLVRRLPVMLLPRWTNSCTHPIALVDVVRAVDRSLGADDTLDQVFDIGGPQTMSYREMLQTTAEVLGVRRLMVRVPFLSPRFSRLWVAAVSRTSPELVNPLVESLRHDMIARSNALLDEIRPEAVDLEAALAGSLEGKLAKPNPRAALREKDRELIRQERRVRSIQRLPMPAGRDARWVREEYARWLPKRIIKLLRCRVGDDGVYRFRTAILPITLLELKVAEDLSTDDRQILHVTGGLLARVDDKRPGRLEFRTADGGKALIAAIHDFSPRLPWYLYSYTQAIIHLWVMRSFGRHLGRLGRVEQTAGEEAAGGAPPSDPEGLGGS